MAAIVSLVHEVMAEVGDEPKQSLRAAVVTKHLSERRIFAGLFALAITATLLFPTYPNYDSYYALVWGNELLDGTMPSYEVYAAPTPHPLWTVWAALLDLVFRGVADRAIVISCVLALVALVWAVFRVGRTCFGPLSGAIAAALVGTTLPFVLFTAYGCVDVPFLAFVLWAAAFEAERPKRGLLPMLLLVVAGLLRPEAWVLAGCYWLWCGWRRWDLMLLVGVAPVLWVFTDAVVTGDPLFSLNSTSVLAEALGRVRGIENVPYNFFNFLAGMAQVPVFLAACGGTYLAWRARARLPALHVPLALFACGSLTFVGIGLAGLSIIPRYLTIPVIAVCLLAGYAIGGFERLSPGRHRELWTLAAIGAAVGLVLSLGVRLPLFGELYAKLDLEREAHTAVVRTADNPRVRGSLDCGPISLPTYRLVPHLRFELDATPQQVVTRAIDAPRRGIALVLVGDEPADRFGEADGVRLGTNVAPPGFVMLGRAGMLEAYAGPPC